MRKIYVRAAAFFAAFAIMASYLFPTAFAITDSGFTHLLTSYCPECYVEITIEGDHFTVDGRVVRDPVTRIKFNDDSVEISDYEFTPYDDYSFHAEFNAVFSGGSCNFRLVGESLYVMDYLIQHDGNGWSFPDNGLAAQNAEKLENIQTAAPEAAAYYISQTADPDEIEQTMKELEQIVSEVCGEEQDDYKKAYLIYRWLGENIYYDNDAADTGVTLDTVAVHNVLERRRTTCAGYSNTYCAMLEIAGIRSVNLKGSSVAGDVTYETLTTGGENHEFTAFWYEAENRWAYADPTWGRCGKYENGVYIEDQISLDKYFDETNEAFALKHRIDKVEERSYTGALEALSSKEDTTEGSEETQDGSEAPATHTTKAPAKPQSDNNTQNGNYVIYIIIGAAGVAIVMIGIVLGIKKRKQDRKDKQK